MQYHDKRDTWSFPEVTLYADLDLHSYPSDSLKLLYDVKVNELNKIIEEKDNLINQLQIELEKSKSALCTAEQSYSDSIKNINAAIPQINKNIVDMILLLTTKFVKTILNKELEIDDSASQALFENLTNQIKTDGVLQVEVSAQDYEILTSKNLSGVFKLKINNSLSKGDFIFNTNTGVYIHRIDDRVNELMSAFYE